MHLWKIVRSPGSAWLFTGIGIGVLLAFPLAAPILGSVIPESAGTLWGSALGAMIAVGGAYLVAGFQFGEQRRSAASLMYSIFSLPVYELERVFNALGSPSSEQEPAGGYEPVDLSRQEWIDIKALSQNFLTVQHVAKMKSNRIDGALNLLAPRELVGVFALEAELESATDTFDELLNAAINAARHTDGAPVEWAIRCAVKEHFLKARSSLDRFHSVLQ